MLIFFIFTIPIAFILKDDANSYARVLFHEFYNQDKIDYLVCGASHVSHGVEANNASQKLGKAVFNAGTPSQKIDGTYAILRQAVKLYKIEKVEYAGKGCVLDLEEIPDGGFSNDSKEGKINVSEVSEDWKDTIDKIIALCRENDIELILFSMPCSDFYLNERGNYDEYYSFCRDFTAEKGFSYYDFNLARPEILSLTDSDFRDDNHFCKKGVYVWTNAFCDFFGSKYKEENALEKYFYSSFAQKMAEMPEKIFGLYMPKIRFKRSFRFRQANLVKSA